MFDKILLNDLKKKIKDLGTGTILHIQIAFGKYSNHYEIIKYKKNIYIALTYGLVDKKHEMMNLEEVYELIDKSGEKVEEIGFRYLPDKKFEEYFIGKGFETFITDYF